MKAMVYHGPGDRRLETVPDPRIEQSSDAIVRLTSITICGTDLHILKGDVPAVKPGTILGHEAVGIVEETGSAVTQFRRGDRVLVPAITSCGVCEYCRRQMYGQCLNGGGWIFGHLINGLQAELARVPFADTSIHKVPDRLEDADVLFLTDILATGYECGIVRGGVKPGNAVAIVGAGPIGLSALVTGKLHGPRAIIMIDKDDNRLELATRLGADHTLNPDKQDIAQEIMRLTGLGVDVAVEAVGVPETFELCADLIRPGGTVANVGVHGKPVSLHLERLWIKDITVTTQLVDGYTIPLLLQLIEMGKLDPKPFATHNYQPFDRFVEAYDVFSKAAEHKACKVIVKAA